MRRTIMVGSLVALMGLSACDDMSGSGMDDSVQYGLLGAVAGAAVGYLVSDDDKKNKNALIGAALGGVTGVAITF